MADRGAAPGASAGAGRLPVSKTYKLFISGAFPRSESGRSYVVNDVNGGFLANASRASRKDARDAVVAARKAFPGWSGATAYNRGQVLYRVAEMLEARRGQFVAAVAAAEGLDDRDAHTQVDVAIDRWVWFVGWADKVAQVVGAANPVAGPYFNFTVPEPTGVVALVASQESSLFGLVDALAATVVSGNTAVVVASQVRPLPALDLAEVLATSDVPAGVVNILTGLTTELSPVLAAHMDVNAVDLAGVAANDLAEHQRVAADNVKRVLAGGGTVDPNMPLPDRMLALLELKTVWHPTGL